MNDSFLKMAERFGVSTQAIRALSGINMKEIPMMKFVEDAAGPVLGDIEPVNLQRLYVMLKAANGGADLTADDQTKIRQSVLTAYPAISGKGAVRSTVSWCK